MDYQINESSDNVAGTMIRFVEKWRQPIQDKSLPLDVIDAMGLWFWGDTVMCSQDEDGKPWHDYGQYLIECAKNPDITTSVLAKIVLSNMTEKAKTRWTKNYSPDEQDEFVEYNVNYCYASAAILEDIAEFKNMVASTMIRFVEKWRPTIQTKPTPPDLIVAMGRWFWNNTAMCDPRGGDPDEWEDYGRYLIRCAKDPNMTSLTLAENIWGHLTKEKQTEWKNIKMLHEQNEYIEYQLNSLHLYVSEKVPDLLQ